MNRIHDATGGAVLSRQSVQEKGQLLEAFQAVGIAGSKEEVDRLRLQSLVEQLDRQKAAQVGVRNASPPVQLQNPTPRPLSAADLADWLKAKSLGRDKNVPAGRSCKAVSRGHLKDCFKFGTRFHIQDTLMLTMYKKAEYGENWDLLTSPEYEEMKTMALGRLRFHRRCISPCLPVVCLNGEKTRDEDAVKLHLLPRWMYIEEAHDMLFTSEDWEKFLKMMVFMRCDDHGYEDEPWKWTRTIVLIEVGDSDLWEYIGLYTDQLYGLITCRNDASNTNLYVAPETVRFIATYVWMGEHHDRLVAQGRPLPSVDYNLESHKQVLAVLLSFEITWEFRKEAQQDYGHISNHKNWSVIVKHAGSIFREP